MPRGRLRRLDGCIGATTSGRGNPRVKRVGPRRGERGQGGKRVGGEVARGRISQERRKEGVGLPVGKRRRAGGDQLNEPCRLEEPRRARAGDLQGRLQPTVAIGHVAGRIVGKRPGIRRLAPERSPTRVAAQQPAVDFLERRRRSPRVAGGREQLGLGRKQPRPQRGQVAPRPRTAPLDRGRHASTAGHRIGGGRERKGLLERAGIAEVGGGVGGFLEELRSPLRLIGLEGHPPEDDQAPARQPVVEAVAHEEPAGEQGRGLIVLALRPGGGTKRDVDPRVRPVIGRCGPPHERLRRGVEPAALRCQVAEQHAVTIDGDHQQPHDLLRPHHAVVVGREHAAALEHLLRVGGLLSHRRGFGNRGRRRIPLAAPPGRNPTTSERPQWLRGELHREQPLAMRGKRQHRFVVAGDGIAETAKLVKALAEQRGRGDRVDPPLRADTDASLVVLAGNLGGRGVLALGEGLERQVVRGRGHRIRPTRHAHVWRQDNLTCGDAGRRNRNEKGPGETVHDVVVHGGGQSRPRHAMAGWEESEANREDWANPGAQWCRSFKVCGS